MSQINVALRAGPEVTFDIEDERGDSAYFVLGLRKCGSSLLNMLCETLARVNGHSFLDVGGAFFERNILAHAWVADPALRALLRPGVVYGGFRLMPRGFAEDPLFETGPKVLMVRDPRDAMVSEFFSNAYSHSVPDATEARDDVKQMMETERARALQTSIDAYVLPRAEGFSRQMMDYAQVARSDSTLVLRYEDWIFRKDEWIRLLARQFGWSADDELIGHMLKWADVRPDQEDPTAFVRKVTPGDHREKLSASTIEALNGVFREPMALFGYEPG